MARDSMESLDPNAFSKEEQEMLDAFNQFDSNGKGMSVFCACWRIILVDDKDGKGSIQFESPQCLAWNALQVPASKLWKAPQEIQNWELSTAREQAKDCGQKCVGTVFLIPNPFLLLASTHQSIHVNYSGFLSRIELQETIEDLTGQEFSMDHVEILYEEFDKDQNGKVDFPEFKTMMKYLKSTLKQTKRKSVSILWKLDDLYLSL